MAAKKRTTKTKPAWPLLKSSGVRMSAHASGQWCKRVNNRLHYFGPWSDPVGALARYRAVADELHAGRDAPTSPTATDTPTVRDTINRYLAARLRDVRGTRDRDDDLHDTSIAPERYQMIRHAGRIIAKHFGPNTDAEGITPDQWSEFRQALAARYKPSTLAGLVNHARTIWRWSYDAGHLKNPPRFGPGFKVVGVKRATRRRRRIEGGKLLAPETIRALLIVADPMMATAILLGCNAMLTTADLNDLRGGDIDFDRRLLDYPRSKNDIPRYAVLWPETLRGIRWLLDNGPEPANPAHAGRVFLTASGDPIREPAKHRQDGTADGPRRERSDKLAHYWRALFKSAGIERPNRCGHAWLRHASYTEAARSRDIATRDLIAGHAASGMTENYLEQHDPAPLYAMADHLHAWLKPDTVALAFDRQADH